jgi:branched-chain amino acid transport system substrate-binding protein
VAGGETPTGGATTGATTAPGGATGGAAPVAGDRTGISDTTLTIGMHAPLTGAAPVPTDSFAKGVPIYWDYIQKTQKGVFGRQVRVKFYDDEFNPSTAVQRCRQMVEQDKVFLIIGIAGADQITACAKYANSVGVPYLSAGVNQQGLETLRGYFAASQTYVQQNPMLAQLAAKRLSKNKKFGIVIEDTPTFRESMAGIKKAAADNGLQVVYEKFMSKGGGPAEMLTIANQLRTSGADVVYFLGPPANPQGGGLVSLAQQGQGQGYTPTYIGPGLSAGLNIVLAPGCPGLANAHFLSPFPSLDVADKFDPNYKKEYRAQTNSDGDDIGFALWGLAKGLHQELLAAGKDMTRQSFVQLLESGKLFEGGIYSKVQYSPKNHFGAQASHLLVADCGSRTWKTTETFVSGF